MRPSRSLLSRVAVLGAAGGIGQPLSLLLKCSPLVTKLSLYDIRGAPGVAADLSHIPSPAEVTGYAAEELEEAVNGAELVLIPAGIPRKPGMTRDDLFNANAGIVRDLTVAVGHHAPKAIIGVIANPVNSTVPVAAETLRKIGVYDPARLFGITTLDVVRARAFVAEALRLNPYDVDVSVIGGHSGKTIVPLLSRFPALSQEQVQQLTHRIQFAGDEVVKAKAGTGSATLSMAYAGSEWTFAMLKALRGDKGIVECCYVENDLQQPSCRFFACPVELGKGGVERVLPMPELNVYEQQLLETCIPALHDECGKGIELGVKTHLTPDE
ncbi:putative mitochondrial mitochondrial malate dehydrogenase (mMDH) [Leptomonas pyrrhocoris]|uniref:Malate dehydrogenase n=1 Tax=Leptomonas pyrrhocoris TaxID=157538 RepID=A0A0M9G4D1_LEPPY|nr:putative mitochondrial mitochondrial malate dehydrogenase (mMDH) [Leptomonas pyrrhocoris]KPA81997.1 putative mitochondrial mitochondrial malate dehydrogenase (mMDH) [Leptomonas pyrrhocoris]|eukprot:XP_015660436.1 putative mitochondrial mitochondrial malate dehydrogenase (mMDH) [Leptomonas pyrrhocoris]